MKTPFAYVLSIVIARAFETRVSLYQTLPEVEEALRAYAGSKYVGLSDDEIVETLVEEDTHVHIHAVTQKRNKQTSVELRPFARAKAA